jgi:hypothetical protein
MFSVLDRLLTLPVSNDFPFPEMDVHETPRSGSKAEWKQAKSPVRKVREVREVADMLEEVKKSDGIPGPFVVLFFGTILTLALLTLSYFFGPDIQAYMDAQEKGGFVDVVHRVIGCFLCLFTMLIVVFVASAGD